MHKTFLMLRTSDCPLPVLVRRSSWKLGISVNSGHLSPPSLYPSVSLSHKHNFSPFPPPPLPTTAAAGIRTFDDPVDEGQGGAEEGREGKECVLFILHVANVNIHLQKEG